MPHYDDSQLYRLAACRMVTTEQDTAHLVIDGLLAVLRRADAAG